MIQSKLVRHSQIYFFTTLLIALFLPLSKIIIPYLIIILVLNWLIEGRFREKLNNIRYRYLMFLFIGFFLMHIIGLAYSANLEFGLFDIEIKLSLLIFPLIFSTIPVFKKKRIDYIFIAFIIGCLLNSFISLFNAYPCYIETKQTACFFSSSLSNMLHPSYFALYICFAEGILIYWLINNIRLWHYWKTALVVLLVFYFLLFVVLLASKMGIIVLLIECVFFLFYIIAQKVKGILPVIISVIVLVFVLITTVIMSPVTSTRMQAVIETLQKDSNTIVNTNKTSVESNTLRILVWKTSWQLIKNNPLGVGTGDIKDVLLNKYKEYGMTGALEFKLNCHNQYLQSFLAIGVFGFLLLLSSLLLPMYYCLKQKQYIYLLFLIIISTNLLVESMLEVQAGVVFYGFFNAFLLFINDRSNI